MLRAIKEIQPKFVVAENVPGLLTIENGLVFEQVCLDLENEGYEVSPVIIPACAKDAAHIRDRVWIIANSKHFRDRRGQQQPKSEHKEAKSTLQSNITYPNSPSTKHEISAGGNLLTGEISDAANVGNTRARGAGFKDGNINASNASSEGLERNDTKGGLSTRGWNTEHINGESWLEAATRLCGLDDGLARGLDIASISKSKWRTESLKAYGNAIYWPVAFEIFKAIKQTDKNINV